MQLQRISEDVRVKRIFQFVELVRTMREAQKLRDQSRSDESLMYAKSTESQVDKLLIEMPRFF